MNSNKTNNKQSSGPKSQNIKEMLSNIGGGSTKRKPDENPSVEENKKEKKKRTKKPDVVYTENPMLESSEEENEKREKKKVKINVMDPSKKSYEEKERIVEPDGKAEKQKKKKQLGGRMSKAENDIRNLIGMMRIGANKDVTK